MSTDDLATAVGRSTSSVRSALWYMADVEQATVTAESGRYLRGRRFVYRLIK
jgi:hypothetical protein